MRWQVKLRPTAGWVGLVEV